MKNASIQVLIVFCTTRNFKLVKTVHNDECNLCLFIYVLDIKSKFPPDLRDLKKNPLRQKHCNFITIPPEVSRTAFTM